MKKIILTLSFLLLSVNSFASELPEFSELSITLQNDIIRELGAEPVFIKDLSAYTGVEGSYIGLVKKDNEVFSFDAFIWYGTQGTDGIAISNITQVDGI
ncbi:MAG: hypothetical protein CME63_02385 [Halobacteriovoraceae bacterium]|nr:hypothetical protein [Halobacteriovoraceae bacterium]|tara:strand:+ start:122403 stop:122699 length:297 start_codon:yes stop_codon:yes gene_type:complete